jgi:DDE superfamily endonuclease/Helix-turn-helix of DDE superfamily endonuclease
MITYTHLKKHGTVFVKMTGLRPREFDALLDEVMARFAKAEERRLERTERQRAIGGGDKADLSARDQILLTVIWLRLYPTHDVLGFLFGVSQPTVGRYIGHVLPVLEKTGQASMRLPDPGRKRRRKLPDLVKDIPELAVVVDTFEQAVQRPKDPAERAAWYSGKQRCHTIKTQVSVDENTGWLVDVSDSVEGRSSDITLLRQTGLLSRLPPDIACMGDTAYQGITKLHHLGFSPCKRLGKHAPPLSDDQIAYNHAFACRRIIVENTINRLRSFQSLSQRDRQHRSTRNHHARTCAVAALVNCQLHHRLAL